MEELARSVLRQNLDTVRESSVDPVWLSVKLHSIRIIGDTDLAKARNAGESEANRRTDLVCTLMGNGGLNVFQTFVDILLNQEEVNWLGKKLKGMRFTVKMDKLYVTQLEGSPSSTQYPAT